MLVCLFMQTFDMRFADGYVPQQWEADMKDFLVTTKGELPTILKRRRGAVV